MRIKLLLVGAALSAAAALGASQASAQSFTATYFEVSPSTPDFNGPPCGDQDCGQVYTNNADGEVTGALVNGLPYYNTAFTGEALHDLNGDGTLAWWSGTPTGTATVNLPISFVDGGQGLFPPNGTGNNDGASFQTAIFTQKLVVGAGGENVTFNMSSDDDSFL